MKMIWMTPAVALGALALLLRYFRAGAFFSAVRLGNPTGPRGCNPASTR